MLQLGEGAATGSILGDVVNEGTLAFNRSDMVTFDGQISGGGLLHQMGGGTTVLTGGSSHAGGTVISHGMLQLGNGGTTGAIQGDVANNGVLAFNRADEVVFGGRVTGTGQLHQIGGGTTVLTGDSSHAGGTVISSGVLQLGDGGTTGSILGDVINNAALAFDRADNFQFAGLISGAGELRQIGSGVTVLSGANTYSGATRVENGTLLVNGDQSGATGLTSAASGASLGGSGRIGGDVVVGDGASLTPGGAVGQAGTLSIGGDLTLAAGSNSNFQFGAANVAGGGLNDMVNVGGDLTLDGTLNVAVTAGGAFDAGVYRVFNYDGTLIDNGLELGALPAGADVIVQTSVANQVNLVNAGGLALNFWDGAAGPKFDGQVSGGDGVWQNGSGNNNWTEATGAINAGYDDGAFAIFMGAKGVVDVDNSLGAVTAAGMQFATDGYRIQGGDLTLVGPQSTIRVGDGTAAGAGITATIASRLVGDSQLVKTDLGTLVLTAENGFTGGTLVHEGVLQLGDGGTTGSILGDVVNDGVLAFNRSDVVTFAGQISGGGLLRQIGGGTTILSGDSMGFLGQTQVARGILAVTGKLGGGVEVQSGARLEGTGVIGGADHRQGGIIAPGMNGLGVLTLTGDYVGAGGTLEIEAVLGGDDSAADRLVIGGGATGAATVQVLNRGGLGAQTVEGVKIIDIAGGSSAKFTLAGDYLFEGEQAVIAGAYAYVLRQNGVTGPADGDWYLRSSLISQPTEPIYQPGVPVYEAYPRALAALNGLPTLRQRVGDRQQAADGAWIRAEGSMERLGAERSTSATESRTQTWKVQMGVDRVLASDATGDALIGAVTAHYGEANANAASVYGAGGVDGRGYGLGATLTWYGANGWYVDGQAQFSRFESDLSSVVLGDLVEGNTGYGQIFGLEGGRAYDLGGGITLTPQAQAVYSRVTFDRFVDPSEAIVAIGDNRSLDTRVGAALDYVKAWSGQGQGGVSRFYAVANLHYEWLDGVTTTVSGASFGAEGRPLWGEAGLGASHDWADGRYVLFGEVSAATAFDHFGDDRRIKGAVGFRMQF